MTIRRRAGIRRVLAATATVFVTMLAAMPSGAQAEDVDTEAMQLGADVYQARCAACHQADGTGIPGSIPPVVGTPRLADTDYLIDVIVNGLRGEIDVGGVVYSGEMPAFPALSDDELGGLVAYVQAGLEIPEPSHPAESSTTSSLADQTPPPAPDEQIREGAAVYAARCAACHQAGGVGLAETFPPLLGNPRVSDTAYLVDVIRNGLQGPLEVAGVQYDGVMQPFPNLPDGELEALIAYMQGGFVLPVGEEEQAGTDLPIATGSLPALTQMAIFAAFAIAAAAGLFVLGPRVISPVNRLAMPWLDAVLRSIAIVLFLVLGTTFVPSIVLRTAPVSRLARPIQDLIGTGLWLGALGVGLAGLWWAHRKDRI